VSRPLARHTTGRREREVLVSPRQAELPVPAGTVIGDTVYPQRAVTDTRTEP
jgi:hypothetical protein